jgi:multicomponent Na+:H+ antiporter subunit E
VIGRIPQVLWLTLVWVLLWGTVTGRTIAGGLLVATVVTVLFPLPPMASRLPLRPWRILRLAGFVAVDLLRSAVQVTWETLRHGPRARAGIIAVPLLAGSARVVAMVAAAISLSPGSFVLQLDRAGALWYVYVLGLAGPDDAERARRQVLELQRRVIAAFGTTDELAAADRGLATA